MHGGDRPAGFGTTDEGRLDLRGLIVPEPVELADIVVPSAVPGNTMTFTQTSGRVKIAGQEWMDVDLSYSWLASLGVENFRWVNCRFDAAVLRDSRIWDTDVQDCTFESADLRGAPIGTATLAARDTWWRNVSFRDAVMGAGGFLSGWHAEDVSFEGAKIVGLDFEQVTLVRVVFDGKLRKVHLNNRVVEGDPAPGPLVDCDFSRCTFDDVEFENVHLTNVAFPPGSVVVGNAVPVAGRALRLLPDDDERGVGFARDQLRVDAGSPGTDAVGAAAFALSDLGDGENDNALVRSYVGSLEWAARELGTPILLDGGVFVGPPAPVPGTEGDGGKRRGGFWSRRDHE